jgi:hypothetical protein
MSSGDWYEDSLRDEEQSKQPGKRTLTIENSKSPKLTSSTESEFKFSPFGGNTTDFGQKESPKSPLVVSQQPIKPIIVQTPQELTSLFFKNKDYSDCSVVNQKGEETPANILFLTSRSPVFATMLHGRFKESTDKKIHLEFSQDVIDAFLGFIYTFEPVLPVSKEFRSIFQLLQLADQHEFKRLTEFLNSHLASVINLDNTESIYDLACEFGMEKARITCCDFWNVEDPYLLYRKDLFDFSIDRLLDHLENDLFPSTSLGETSVFERIEEYAQKNTSGISREKV